MKFNKKFIVIGGAIAFVVIGIAASKPPGGKYKNLKVLPKNISEQTMDTVMHEFEKALGVECDFCHVKPADYIRDMALDDKAEKNIARKMITMAKIRSIRIFLMLLQNMEMKMPLLEIHCVTCHHGEPHPKMGEEEENKEKQQ